MINFRYHVVSILAVFLAIAIGTVMGASFVGRGVIDSLQSRITRVQRLTDAQRDRNDKLQGEIGKLGDFVDETAGYTVARSLTAVRVNVVAERGTDGDAVDRQGGLVRQAGATVPGVVWLEDSWKLESADAAAALRAATGLTTRDRAALRSAAARMLGQRLTIATPPIADDVLVKLVDAKFVTLAGVAGSPSPVATDFVGSTARVLAMGGPGHLVPADVTPAVAGGVLDGGASVVVGEVFAASDVGPDRAGWIDAVLKQPGLANHISTVDDLERTEGRVGAALALSELALGTVGNYGLGRDRAVPEKIATVPSAR